MKHGFYSKTNTIYCGYIKYKVQYIVLLIVRRRDSL